MSTRWPSSLGLCIKPVELQDRIAMRQLEHGDTLSQRICRVLGTKLVLCSAMEYNYEPPRLTGPREEPVRQRRMGLGASHTLRVRHWSH